MKAKAIDRRFESTCLRAALATMTTLAAVLWGLTALSMHAGCQPVQQDTAPEVGHDASCMCGTCQGGLLEDGSGGGPDGGGG